MNSPSRQDQILAGKLDLLFRGHIAVPGNMAVALVVAFLLRDAVPAWFLVLWLAATAAVGLARLQLHRRFLAFDKEKDCTPCWAAWFSWGTFASGVLWGTMCASLAHWGTTDAYVLMTFVTAGMTAGALATFAPYMPAYLAYATPFTFSMAGASLLSQEHVIAGNGVLILLYFTVITVTCRYFNRFVNHTVELQVDNAILRGHLSRTRQERDRARKDKWSALAQLSHELRTPLNAIMGFSEAMRDEVLGALGNRRYKDYAAHIHASGSQLLTLTDELMLLSQSESGTITLKEEAVDIAALLTRLSENSQAAAAKAGLTLTLALPQTLPALKADRSKLRQVLRHLLDNAIKFTPAGGAVQIAVEVAANGALTLIVEDTGIGMEPQDIARALRPFGRIATPLTANAAGAGLGLPICLRLCEAHGASLTLQSKPGEGTRAAIGFPCEASLPRPGESTIAAA